MKLGPTISAGFCMPSANLECLEGVDEPGGRRPESQNGQIFASNHLNHRICSLGGIEFVFLGDLVAVDRNFQKSSWNLPKQAMWR
jgi:hypothetical protein